MSKDEFDIILVQHTASLAHYFLQIFIEDSLVHRVFSCFYSEVKIKEPFVSFLYKKIEELLNYFFYISFWLIFGSHCLIFRMSFALVILRPVLLTFQGQGRGAFLASLLLFDFIESKALFCKKHKVTVTFNVCREKTHEVKKLSIIY